MHISDILPTFATATGIDLGVHLQTMDGVDHWNNLMIYNSSDVRKSMLYNVDEEFGYYAYMEDGWKIVKGTTLKGLYDSWMGDFIVPEEKMNATFYTKLVLESKVHQAMHEKSWLTPKQILDIQNASKVDCGLDFNEETVCDPLKKPCLFDLFQDPCEYTNLADEENDIFEHLASKLEEYRMSALPIRNKPPDFNANPIYYNNTWTYWQEPKHEKYPEVVFLIVISVSGMILLAIVFSIIKRQLCNKSFDQANIPKISKMNEDGNENNNFYKTTVHI